MFKLDKRLLKIKTRDLLKETFKRIFRVKTFLFWIKD